jgi:hypothetical protein
MNKKVILLGLPGLYQNWLMGAVDPASTLQLHGTQNFFCPKSIVKWVIKINLNQYPVASDETIVINLVVNKENMPWYLYNLFEKTYDIKIMIDNFIEDLMIKGNQFSIFEFFKKDLQEINLTDENEVINYFYKFFQNKTNFLYENVIIKNPNYVNIEFDDFNNPILLKEKLSIIPNFNNDHFDKLYSQLCSRNKRYLNRKKDFIYKLENKLPLDIIESGYVGSLASEILNKQLPWGDRNLRNLILKNKFVEICALAKTVC